MGFERNKSVYCETAVSRDFALPEVILVCELSLPGVPKVRGARASLKNIGDQPWREWIYLKKHGIVQQKRKCASLVRASGTEYRETDTNSEYFAK